MSIALVAQTDAAKAFIPQISARGVLRASKPKDGVAAYVWRIVAFSLSHDSKHHCMPMTADFGISNDTVPADWFPEIPADRLAKEIERDSRTQHDIDFCIKESGSVEQYVIDRWKRYERRKSWIKEVLDVIVKDIVDSSASVLEQPGTRRWARAMGVF